ncbi:MAG: hypothetical protein EPGJADBJ_00385 [Saprospiraceae bacterium]|nr:hypothetical protein [Saprospiraceae bacterium]
MRSFTRRLSLALFCLSAAPVFSQNILITYQKSDALFVCGADTFFISVQNTGTNPLTGAALDVALPTGVTYLPGTVAGAAQQNVSDLQHPVFGLPAIASGATASVAMLLTADCAAADALDTGQLFIANLTVQSLSGNASVSTTNFALETGLLLIESVEDELMSGEKGDTLLRKICVKNTRLGKIGALHFEDEHQPGFEILVLNASQQSGTNAFWTADFDGTFFSAAGNGDAWLDLNETVCFTERIVITDCGIPEFTAPSVLRAGWGCGGEICRYDSTVVGIEIKKSTQVPDLVITPIWNPPTDYCGNTPAVMGLKINNIGKAEATDVLVRFVLPSGILTLAGMGESSFRIVHNGASTPLFPNLNLPGALPLCNLPVFSDVTLVVPLVEAKDSLLLLFDMFTCESSCNQVLPLVEVEFFYRKPCPPNGFVSDTMVIAPDGNVNVYGSMGFNAGICLQNGQSYEFNYGVVSSRLIGDDGFLHVEFDLPHGLVFDDSCQAKLGGVSPNFNAVTTTPGGGSNVHLAWELPLPNDTLEMDFCLRFECDSTIGCLDEVEPPDGTVVVYAADCNVSCFLQLDNKTYWTPLLTTPYSCAIGSCDSMRVVVNRSCVATGPGGGGGDTTILDPIFPGPGLKKWFNVYRLNYGFEDNDDDRHADSGQPAAMTTAGVRRDRFLPGDTLRVEYCGVVDSGGGLSKFGRTIWHEIVRSDMGGAGDNDVFATSTATNSFTNASRFRYVRDSIRIRYADGTEYGCLLDDFIAGDDQNFFTVNQVNTWPPVVIDNLASQRFRFQFSLEELFLAGCLPKGTLDLGDSIFLYTDFRIGLNFRPASGNDPNPPLVGFRTALSDGGKKYAYNEQPFKKLQYSGIRSTRSPNTHSIRACENSLEVKKFRQALRIARANMFPYEVRPIARISEYAQTVPQGLEAASAQLEYFVLQDSVPWLGVLDLPFTQTPGFLSLDFAPVFSEPVDEGFALRTHLLFQPDCLYDKPDSSRQYVTLNYTNCPDGDTCVVRDSIINTIGFFSNASDLRLETSDTLIVSPGKIFSVDFDLKNYVVSTAFHSWVTVVSPSGEVSDIELFQMPQNQPLTAQNGIYQTDQVGGFGQKSFRLTGQNVSCEPDTLLIIVGWNCSPVTDTAQFSCSRDTYLIELRLEKPELELEILQEPDFVAICDTSDFFEFEIYNAKTGFAYEPFATVKLPPGLFLVPGSCEMSYPAGNAYASIPDPALLPGNVYQWNIAAIQAFIADNGLPGVEADPQNALRIRFRTYTECGFVSNTQVIYGTRGTEPCGRSTNVLNKPGEPLKINGLNPGYGVVLSLQPTGNPEAFCGGTQEFTVQLTLLGTPSAGDSVYILLPQGVTYAEGSYLPVLNAPAGPPTVEPDGIRVALPANAGAGTAVSFRFTVYFGESAGCVDQIIFAQTRVRTEVFCPTLGAPCTVYAATGEAIWNLDLQHPELGLGGIDASVIGDQALLGIKVNNIGQVPASGATVQIWQDVDGNGVVSPGDVLLQTVENQVIIPAGGSYEVTALLTLDPAILCNLIVVLPASENCACADETLPLEMFSLQQTPQTYCEVQTVDVGVTEQPGFTYEWQPANGITCTTCATTTFTPPAGIPPGQPIELTLEEKSGDCTIQHVFTLTFGTPPVSVGINNPAICKGESTTLVALPAGQAYQWSPNAGNDPNAQQQTVTPASTTTYTVTVTFANNCTQTATATVNVSLPDTTLLPGLVTCEGEPVNVLGNLTDVPGLYSDVLQNAAGCDSVVYQNLDVLPRPLTEESFGFCQGDTLFVLDTLLTQNGQVCRTYAAANGCDSVHCVNATTFLPPALSDPDTLIATPGTPVVLNGPGGYVTYTWIPADPNCPNCPDITVPADSGYVEYQLIVADANGCEGTIIYRIIFFPPCDAQRLRIPNAFTPNNDGVNDVFRVVPYEGLELIGSLTIYDRWGEKVYENSGNVSWDGTIGGKPGPSDVYVYRIDIVCDGEPEAIWGDVTLLR